MVDSANDDKRVKRYHAKVRSGCKTCRLRRIKCDETKPICNNCIRVGRECIYEDRLPKLFELSSSKSANNPDETRLSIIRLPLARRYGDIEASRSLDFYLRRTARMLSMATRATSKDLWTVVIPQASWRYKPVREMLLAMSSLDQYLTGSLPSLRVQDEYRTALLHYSKAISTVATSEQSFTCVVLVAVIGWMLELITNRHEAANMHMSAVQRMVGASTSATAEEAMIADLLAQVVRTGQYIRGMNPRRPGHKVRAFSSLTEASSALRLLFEAVTADISTKTTFDDFWCDLDRWRVSFEIFRYLGPESLADKRSVFLAQNIVVSYVELLEADRSAMSQQDNYGRAMYAILADVEYLVEHEDLEELNWILTALLDYIVGRRSTSEDVQLRAKRLHHRLEPSRRYV